MRLALTSVALAYSMSAEPRRSFGTEIASAASPKPPRFVDVDKFDVADGAAARAHLDERGFVVFRSVLIKGKSRARTSCSLSIWKRWAAAWTATM